MVETDGERTQAEEENTMEAIYPGALVRDGAFTRLRIGRVRVTLLMPQAYPSMPPSILASEGVLREEAEAILKEVFHGEVVLYDFVLALLDKQEDAEDAAVVPCEVPCEAGVRQSVCQQWRRGEEIVDRKSVFVAHCTHLCSREEVPRLVHSMEAEMAASHHIVAWRLPQDHDYDDGGERGAGLRLAGMLELMKVEHVLVVASRWYGGVQLGPVRFKHINDCAQSAIRRFQESLSAG